MIGDSPGEKIRYWLFSDRMPTVKLLIVANILSFLALTLFKVPGIGQLGFSTLLVAVRPWTLVTYPLIGAMDILGLLFAAYWLWIAGGSLERSWGSQRFAIFFFAMSAISALGLLVGSFVTHAHVSAMGLWLPLAGITISFAMQNPEQQILFFFVLPMKLKYLALLDAAIVLVSYGQINLLLGVFALLGCAVSYWYVRAGARLELPRRSPGYQVEGNIIRIRQPRGVRFNPLKWYKNYQDEKRLRDFLDRK
jgi:membrane associated rhomboid family serine protease